MGPLQPRILARDLASIPMAQGALPAGLSRASKAPACRWRLFLVEMERTCPRNVSHQRTCHQFRFGTGQHSCRSPVLRIHSLSFRPGCERCPPQCVRQSSGAREHGRRRRRGKGFSAQWLTTDRLRLAAQCPHLSRLRRHRGQARRASRRVRRVRFRLRGREGWDQWGDTWPLMRFAEFSSTVAQTSQPDDPLADKGPEQCVLKVAVPPRRRHWNCRRVILLCSGGSPERPIRNKPPMSGL